MFVKKKIFLFRNVESKHRYMKVRYSLSSTEAVYANRPGHPASPYGRASQPRLSALPHGSASRLGYLALPTGLAKRSLLPASIPTLTKKLCL